MRVPAVFLFLAACGSGTTHSGEPPEPADSPELPQAVTFIPTAFSVDVRGHGRPIIFIPGLGCPGSVWETTADHLAGYEAHLLTLSGFAGRPAIDGPLAATTRDELARYIRAHALDHPVIVGHSMGGYVAYALAESEPELVGPTIVVDSGAALGGDDATANAAAGKQARELWANADDDQFAAQVHDIFSQMVTDPARLEPTLADVARSDRRALGGAIEEMFTSDLRPGLGKIRAPVLLVLADGGLQGEMRAQVAPVADHAVVVIPHTKHFVFVDDPADFFVAIDAFLSAHPG
jgi:N-formylmaleamate deformylase